MIYLRRVLAALLPRFEQGRCLRCWLPWWLVEPHDVAYPPGSPVQIVASFLCGWCWRRLSAAERNRFALLHLADWPPMLRALHRDALLHAVRESSGCWYTAVGWQMHRLGALLARLIPARGHGRCLECLRPWWLVTPHTVDVDPVRDLQVICRRCWPYLSGSVRGTLAAAHISRTWPVERRTDWYRVFRAYADAR